MRRSVICVGVVGWLSFCGSRNEVFVCVEGFFCSCLEVLRLLDFESELRRGKGASFYNLEFATPRKEKQRRERVVVYVREHQDIRQSGNPMVFVDTLR